MGSFKLYVNLIGTLNANVDYNQDYNLWYIDTPRVHQITK